MALTPLRLGKRALLLTCAVGFVLGMGLFTFDYAEGTSYFSTDPRACANCHVMQEQYDSWQKSSHHATATCVQCHLPHAFLPKYIAKAENGYWHSRGFTFMDFHEPILIKPKNAQILQDNCVQCHSRFVHELVDTTKPDAGRCVHCHVDVGHGAKN
ncbi:MAG: cytochrome c nitrite reductase small subunit [Myxococcales bacterium]